MAYTANGKRTGKTVVVSLWDPENRSPFLIELLPPTDAVRKRVLPLLTSHATDLDRVEREFPDLLEYLTLTLPTERLRFQKDKGVDPTAQAAEMRNRKADLELPYLRGFLLNVYDRSILADEKENLLMSPVDGEFWPHQDLEELREMERSFRVRLGI